MPTVKAHVLALVLLWSSFAQALELVHSGTLTPRVPLFTVGDTLIGATDGTALYSLDSGGVLALALRDFTSDRPRYRGDGVFQIEASLYRIQRRQFIEVAEIAHACPLANYGSATAVSPSLWVTVSEPYLYVSSDSGTNWTRHSSPLGSSPQVYFDGEAFVGAGPTGTWRSWDGVSWQRVATEAVQPTFSGELGAFQWTGSHYVFSLLKGEELRPAFSVPYFSASDSPWAITLTPLGVFSWFQDKLWLNGSLMELPVAGRVAGVVYTGETLHVLIGGIEYNLGTSLSFKVPKVSVPYRPPFPLEADGVLAWFSFDRPQITDTRQFLTNELGQVIAVVAGSGERTIAYSNDLGPQNNLEVLSGQDTRKALEGRCHAQLEMPMPIRGLSVYLKPEAGGSRNFTNVLLTVTDGAHTLRLENFRARTNFTTIPVNGVYASHLRLVLDGVALWTMETGPAAMKHCAFSLEPERIQLWLGEEVYTLEHEPISWGESILKLGQPEWTHGTSVSFDNLILFNRPVTPAEIETLKLPLQYGLRISKVEWVAAFASPGVVVEIDTGEPWRDFQLELSNDLRSWRKHSDLDNPPGYADPLITSNGLNYLLRQKTAGFFRVN